nr:MAG TPA: hypothetical protein [Caudoviricetes sp.]
MVHVLSCFASIGLDEFKTAFKANSSLVHIGTGSIITEQRTCINN